MAIPFDLSGNGLSGLFQDSEHYQKQQYMREMAALQNQMVSRSLNDYGMAQAQQVRAVPQPDPGANPVLLLTGEDE